jgi:hypothetical protein
MAVVDPSTQSTVAAALRTAGARTVMTTTIAAYAPG